MMVRQKGTFADDFLLKTVLPFLHKAGVKTPFLTQMWVRNLDDVDEKVEERFEQRNTSYPPALRFSSDNSDSKAWSGATNAGIGPV